MAEPHKGQKQSAETATWRRARSYRLTALVLHRRDYGEADRLVTVLTPDRGKVVLLAKGARKVPSRKAGHLELFTHVRLQVAHARTWPIITQAETLQGFRHIREDLRRTAHAYYVAELLLRFATEGQGDASLFDLAVETFQHLDRSGNLLLVSRWFEAQLLRHMGFQPQLYVCAVCGDALPASGPVYWHPPSGGVLCPDCAEGREGTRPLSQRALKLMRYLASHPFGQVSTLPVRSDLLREVETYIVAYLEHVLERPLASVALLRRLRTELAQEKGQAFTHDTPS